MNRMEAIAHGLGVVGERTAICGTYLAMTSRLLRDNSISLLRRGAPAGGKNFLIGCLSRLMPKDCIISISSASPMALIYHGEDEDALAHKIIVVAEVAAILQTNNGDEHPMVAMLRTFAFRRVASIARSADHATGWGCIKEDDSCPAQWPGRTLAHERARKCRPGDADEVDDVEDADESRGADLGGREADSRGDARPNRQDGGRAVAQPSTLART